MKKRTENSILKEYRENIGNLIVSFDKLESECITPDIEFCVVSGTYVFANSMAIGFTDFAVKNNLPPQWAAKMANDLSGEIEKLVKKYTGIETGRMTIPERGGNEKSND